MKLELRIALGVFLGVSALWVVRYTFNEIVKDRKFDYEQHRWNVTNEITPEKMIANCGSPLKDTTEKTYPTDKTHWRYMYYRPADADLPVLITFDELSDGKWQFISMQIVNDLNDRTIFKGSDGKIIGDIDTPDERLRFFPCMDSANR